MKIDVYDSYATSSTRGLMHFDVFVASGTSSADAHKFGENWLHSIGENPSALSQFLCNFCHSEIARPEVILAIENKGYFILPMEGCPELG